MIPSSLMVRPLQEDDFENWKTVWTDYLTFYETTLEDIIYEMTFARLISPQNRSQNAMVASRGDELLGLVHFIFHPHNWKIEGVCYLQDLYVCQTVRGMGIGKSLIEAVYAEADRRNSPTVYWLTQDFNEQARYLYDKVAHLTPFIKYNR